MPPRKKTPAGPKQVDAITHADKRANLPTADAHDFVAPEIESPLTFRYPREIYTPQLVWRGKEEQDLAEHLEGSAPPIYIQEKIDPRVLIENLRRTAERAEDEPELTLFDAFDGLGELDLVDFYQHEANWSNRMILGDSLNVMASLAERERLRGKVQMIYVDPPYGIKFGSNWQVSARKRDVKDGKLEDATREVEQIKAFRDTWEYGINSYLTYLRDRLTVAKQLLTESGSIFVQIGDQNVHLARCLMDEIFGSENFVSLITFRKTSGASSELLAGVTDHLIWYAKDVASVKYRRLYQEKVAAESDDFGQYNMVLDPDKGFRRAGPGDNERGLRRLRHSPLTSQRPPGDFPVEVDDRVFRPKTGYWKTGAPGMERLKVANRLLPVGNTLEYVRYLDDFPVSPLNNVWNDTVTSGFGDPKVYIVQTNTKVIERCILMTTDPGDLVLDPTCGSGTTAYAAEQWGRRWIMTDTSRVALALARQRIMGARYPWYMLADSPEGRAKESEASGKPLPPAETTNDMRHGFVCQRVQHIMLKSIANNPDIEEGMSREQIDAAIRRHADYELLYDKPYEDPRKVRVAGPFTVESLSPYRALASAGSADEETTTTNAADENASQDDAAFEQSIIANLRAAGIQNGRKHERLIFDTIEPYASPHIQAVGIREEAANGTPRRVGISIGPQYSTVSPRFIKDAARAANHSHDIDLLCVLAFAFDPTVLGTDDEYVTSEEGFANVAAERQLGRVPVLLVRMNADLVMGEELQKTGAGNLFTVFGQPDIEVKHLGDELRVLLRVLLRGVDVYDPNSGKVRSSETGQVALWMIDTAYNGESFFVRHCYFTGNQDPYKRLKAALKAEIDEDAWASLYRTESLPFAKPDTGTIAVKVINDYGDEVMKVIDV